MSAFHKAGLNGFTLIEMMIAIAIVSLTLSLGLSSYRTWIQNNQIRNAAESIQDGILRARGEAVKCNANVAFALGTGSSWTVTHVGDCGTKLAGSVLESKSSSEGSKYVKVSALDKNGNSATTITFNNLGGVADTSTALSQVDVELDPSITSSADLRKLRVAIGLGGNARVCDPNLDPNTSTDPRRCY